MIDIARDAWASYQFAQSKAENEYEEFWRKTFLTKGLAFIKKDYQNVLIIKDWEITFFVYPRLYEGVKIQIRKLNSFQWRNIKIMSESGLHKFLRTLHNITQ